MSVNLEKAALIIVGGIAAIAAIAAIVYAAKAKGGTATSGGATNGGWSNAETVDIVRDEDGFIRSMTVHRDVRPS